MTQYDADWFGRAARTWDDDPRRIDRARRAAAAIDETVGLKAGMRVLEYGAGTGLLGLAIAERVAEVVLMDASPGMVEAASERIRQGGLTNVTAQAGDLIEGPWTGQPFDLVVSLMTLHHVPDIALLLTRLREATVDSGWIAVLDLEPDAGAYHDPEFDGHHGFSRGALRRAFAAAGWAHVSVRNALTTEREVQGETKQFGVFLATAQRVSDH